MTLLAVPLKHKFGRWVGRILLAGLVLVLILGICMALAGTVARSSLAKHYPAPGRLVDVGGYKLHINCVGQGSPTVILEAGLNDFSVQWARVQPEVATFARVCAYDRAGLGWSEPSPYSRTSDTMVRELHTLLRNADLNSPYILVGHSFGGMNMRLYAHHYPNEVAGIVMVDAAHEAQTLRVPALRKVAEATAGQFGTLARLSRLGLLALIPDNIPTRGLPDGAGAQYRAILATTGYFEAAVAETQALEQSFATMRDAKAANMGHLPIVVLSRGLAEPLPDISAADNERYEQTWRAMQGELTALSSNSQEVIAARSGHYIQLQQPQLVVDAIRHTMVQSEARKAW